MEEPHPVGICQATTVSHEDKVKLSHSIPYTKIHMKTEHGAFNLILVPSHNGEDIVNRAKKPGARMMAHVSHMMTDRGMVASAHLIQPA